VSGHARLNLGTHLTGLNFHPYSFIVIGRRLLRSGLNSIPETRLLVQIYLNEVCLRMRLRGGSGADDEASHPGVEFRANLKSISHRCYLFEVAFVWELTKETIVLPLGCLQGGVRCRTNSAHIRQSRPDSSPGLSHFSGKSVSKPFKLFPSSLLLLLSSRYRS